MTTKVRFGSDLHIEFVPRLKKGQLTPPNMGPRETEILLLLGDQVPTAFLKTNRNDSDARKLKKAMRELLKTIIPRYKKVYFLGGNHCSYQGNIDETQDIFNEFLRKEGILPHEARMIENEAVELAPGVMLLGCTLWSDMAKDNPLAHMAVQEGMNDFTLIRAGEDWHTFTTHEAYALHQRSLNHLAEMYHYYTWDYENKRPDGKTRIIVATHHAPSEQSLKDSPRHGGPVDHGYFSSLEDWILDRPQITDWLHGHTHWNVDYMIGNCRVRANMRGYGVSWAKDACFNSFSVENSFLELENEDAKKDNQHGGPEVVSGETTAPPPVVGE